MSSNQVANAQKRRSSRIEKAIPLAVHGVDASSAPFREEVTTVAISCHGCSYQMKHEVLPGAMVVLDMGQRAKGYSQWPARARVSARCPLSCEEAGQICFGNRKIHRNVTRSNFTKRTTAGFVRGDSNLGLGRRGDRVDVRFLLLIDDFSAPSRAPQQGSLIYKHRCPSPLRCGTEQQLQTP